MVLVFQEPRFGNEAKFVRRYHYQLVRACGSLPHPTSQGHAAAGVRYTPVVSTVVKTIVTLVHGTWAPGAPWTQKESPLRSELTKTFGDTLECRPFEWSGHNSFAARSQAALDLHAMLTQQMTAAPDARHAIIAHSHGGNIALYSLRDPALALKTAAVVCLSTPFITTYRRQFGENSSVVTGLAAVYVSVFTGLACATAAQAVIGASDAGYWGILYLLLAAVSGGLTWWGLTRLTKAWLRHAATWAREVTIDTNLGQKLLVIHPAADEAAEGLSSAHFATAVMVSGWKMLAWLTLKPLAAAADLDEWADPRWYRRLLVAALLYLASISYLHYMYPTAPPDRMFMVTMMMGVSLFGAAIFARDVAILKLVAFATAPAIVVVGAVFVGLLILLSLATLPFNTAWRHIPSFVKTAIWLGPIGVTASAIPAGSVGTVRQLPGDAMSGLRHSRPYDDPATIALIVERFQSL